MSRIFASQMLSGLSVKNTRVSTNHKAVIHRLIGSCGCDMLIIGNAKIKASGGTTSVSQCQIST